MQRVFTSTNNADIGRRVQADVAETWTKIGGQRWALRSGHGVYANGNKAWLALRILGGVWCIELVTKNCYRGSKRRAERGEKAK
jgi:hypothetical protein